MIQDAWGWYMIQDAWGWYILWDDPEGWYGEGGGRGFKMGNICTPVADSF